VLFNGEPAPILYAQNGQVNAIAPFTLIPGTPVTVEVEYNGSRTSVTATVESVRPQIFTLDGSGSGQAAILNQDGTVNGPQNPARTGSIVSLFLRERDRLRRFSGKGKSHEALKPNRFRIFASHLRAEPLLCWNYDTLVRRRDS
jgi:hypothetical protein